MTISSRKGAAVRDRGARRPPAGEGGQTLVEFSICLVLFLLLVFGVFDLGRGVYAYNTITHCAREGVRYAVVHGSKSATPVGPAANDVTLANWVYRYAVGLQTNNLTVTSSWPDGNVAGSNAVVNITVRYTFQPVTAFFTTLTLSNHSAGIILR